MKYAIGIDLGGTKLAVALIRSDGKIVDRQKNSVVELKRSSTFQEGPKRVVELMIEMITEIRFSFPKFFHPSTFAGVGLASAGPLNVEKGCLINPVNFPTWRKVPIHRMLTSALAKIGLEGPVAFQNDAIAAALAEAWVGGARGLSSFAVITIGTGIGTGVIFRGEPVQTHGMGSEFGHLIADSHRIMRPKKDLHRHTIEGIASGTGILRRAQDMGFKGMTNERLVQELKAGRKKYQTLFNEAADTLAALCYNLSVGFNLEKILFSGGLIHVRSLYFDRMMSRYNDLICAMNSEFKAPLQVAKCSTHAGVLGAASLVFKKPGPNK